MDQSTFGRSEEAGEKVKENIKVSKVGDWKYKCKSKRMFEG